MVRLDMELRLTLVLPGAERSRWSASLFPTVLLLTRPDTWNYEYTEPSPPLIAPKQQAPQLAPVEKIEYPKEKVLYAKKEYSYKILQDATRGEYLLAVCEEKIWDPKEDVDVKPAVAVKKVEEKSAEKPVAPVEEKKESPAVGANKKAAKRSQADADGDNTERKYGEKGVKMKTVGVERVPEWRTNVDAVQKAEVDKKSRNTCELSSHMNSHGLIWHTAEIKSKDKPKTRKEKKVYIEDDSEDEIKEIKRRGKRQHTK